MIADLPPIIWICLGHPRLIKGTLRTSVEPQTSTSQPRRSVSFDILTVILSTLIMNEHSFQIVDHSTSMCQLFYKGVSILESLAKVEHMVLWRDKGVGRLRLLYVSVISSSYQSTGPLTIPHPWDRPHRDTLVHSGAGEKHMASPALSLRSGTIPH